jgi:hypothetical protein
MKGRLFGTLRAFALVAMVVPLLLACSPNEGQPTLMPPPQETEAEKAKREADAAEIVAKSQAGGLAPDMTSVTGEHMLTFEGGNPVPNKFSLMNTTGFAAEGDKWTTKKTITFVPTGGSAGFDRYVLDVTKASNGTLSGSVSYTRKMVLVTQDTNKDYATITLTWDGTVAGTVDSYGKITGTITGTAKNTETYFEKGRPADGKPPASFTWTFTGQY